MRTQVGIVGGGPAGLLLSHLLHLSGIESIVIEAKSRRYVEERVRAGVLEQGSADLLAASGVGERMRKEGLVHEAIQLLFNGERHRVHFKELVGRCVVVYGQQEVVKDLIQARLGAGGEIVFEASDVRIHDLHSDRPQISYRDSSGEHVLECGFIAGCDGFHGICRRAIPAGALRFLERAYPFAWLGILAQVKPASEELVYSHHDRGFALLSMRSPAITRFYLQCAPDEDLSEWPDTRIWEELQIRLACGPDFHLSSGPVLQKSIAPMRSFVAEPMQYGRLFLAGDSAHIVPPAGAKGMNLAISDASVLARGFQLFFAAGKLDGLDSYSQNCLRRVWRAQHFSWWMTSMLHRFDGEFRDFDHRRQLAELDYVANSRGAAASFAENYTNACSL